jgi:hypothetical protein
MALGTARSDLVRIALGATLCLFTVAGSATTAPMLLSDPQALEALRLSHNPDIRTVLHAADKALSQEPLSVMQKQGLAPSGDKHDFYSLSIYDWPDPEHPDGPYVHHDGRRNPESDGPKYDKHAWGLLVSSVSDLAEAWALSRDPRYAVKAGRLLRVWFLDPDTRMNPNLDFGQVQPGHGKQHNGIIDTADLPRLLDGIALLSSSPALARKEQTDLDAWMSSYLDWLISSPPGRQECAAKNNRGVWYDAQVAALAIFIGQPDRLRACLERTRERLRAQVAEDGSLPAELTRTKSFHYSVYDLRAFAFCARLGQANQVDLWSDPALRRALAFLAPYADPSKAWPYPELEPRDTQDLAWLLVMASGPLHEASWMAHTGWSTDETALRLAMFK